MDKKSKNIPQETVTRAELKERLERELDAKIDHIMTSIDTIIKELRAHAKVCMKPRLARSTSSESSPEPRPS